MFEPKTDFPSANELKARIAELKLAMGYTKKSVRVIQNKKKLVELEEELQRKMYQHNKFDMFNYLYNQTIEAYNKEGFQWLNELSYIR